MPETNMIFGPDGKRHLRNPMSPWDHREMIALTLEKDSRRYGLTKGGISFSAQELAIGPKKILKMLLEGDSVENIKTELMNPENKIHPAIQGNILGLLTELSLVEKYSTGEAPEQAPSMKLKGPGG